MRGEVRDPGLPAILGKSDKDIGTGGRFRGRHIVERSEETLERTITLFDIFPETGGVLFGRSLQLRPGKG